MAGKFKWAVLGLLLIGNEIVSWAALAVLAVMLLSKMAKEGCFND